MVYQLTRTWDAIWAYIAVIAYISLRPFWKKKKKESKKKQQKTSKCRVHPGPVYRVFTRLNTQSEGVSEQNDHIHMAGPGVHDYGLFVMKKRN